MTRQRSNVYEQPNQTLETNCRLASPLKLGRQFECAVRPRSCVSDSSSVARGWCCFQTRGFSTHPAGLFCILDAGFLKRPAIGRPQTTDRGNEPRLSGSGLVRL